MSDSYDKLRHRFAESIGFANPADRASTRLFPGNFGALFSGFRKADRDRLFSAGDPAALSAFPRSQRTAISAAHRTFHGLACRFAISGHWFSSRVGSPELLSRRLKTPLATPAAAEYMIPFRTINYWKQWGYSLRSH
jgi:hypothetical protein